MQWRSFLLHRRAARIRSFSFLALLFSLVPCVPGKYYADSSEEVYGSRGGNGHSNGSEIGISPPVGNLALHAVISANATCGLREPETYCKLVEHVYSATRPSQCNVCDSYNSDKKKRHPIKYAIDGSENWWQSPTLQNGLQYEWITIDIDLTDVFQVAYIIIKAAISPRPGNWILERSLDGVIFTSWQYYAMSDDECLTQYGIKAKPGKPSYEHDEEVICTSYFSKLDPIEYGEIHTSLVNGRPGAMGPTEALIKFTMARFIRIRLQKLRTLLGHVMTGGRRNFDLAGGWDKTVMRRYFYSISDISIGGHCVCFGHANKCDGENSSGKPSAKCMCQHNTCGDRCDYCCPLYNQYVWGPGNSTDSAACEKCECYGHADSCVYDGQVHVKRLSMNTFGTYDGGGVCINCKDHTTGINCEKCEEGFFRPPGVPLNHPKPCTKCNCHSEGSKGTCVTDENMGILINKSPGECICKEGYAGATCNKCAQGFRGFPKCEACPCNVAGIVNSDCEGECICKENVQGAICGDCKKGFFNIVQENPNGCSQCFCHGVTGDCSSSNFGTLQLSTRGTEDVWFITDFQGTKSIRANRIGESFHITNEDVGMIDEYFWTTEMNGFSGKKIGSYGLKFVFQVSWVLARGDSSGRPIIDYDLLIQSSNLILAFGHSFYEGNNVTLKISLNELNCFVIPDVDNNILQSKKQTPCSRYDVMEGLSGIKRFLLRAKFNTNQIEGMLHYAYLETADFNNQETDEKTERAVSVEVCNCPKGYKGTSCEECDYGYRKSSEDSWLNECVRCNCNGHAKSCDLEGKCSTCEHNTTGANCHLCIDGFYGDPTVDLNPCKPCECPLLIQSNNFSPTCAIKGNSFECTACAEGYEGPFCERCGNGYYGNPNDPGDTCKPCSCRGVNSISHLQGNICDHLTGECLACPLNTVGWNCNECDNGFFGEPLNGTCLACDCDTLGSKDLHCDKITGKCNCKENFSGRSCDVCFEGFGNKEEGCSQCRCNEVGSNTNTCDSVSGQCPCKPGVGGRYCNHCLDYHFGFSFNGCTECSCHPDGSDSSICDIHTGQCHCLPNVEGRKCDQCGLGYWNTASGAGCELCNCDPIGSIGTSCDVMTGQCYCKPGVGGLYCNHCLEKFYDFTDTGCKECDPCEREGHICSPDTGRCICPPNTEGNECEKCSVGCWGFSRFGCQDCNCSLPGALTPQCSPETGKCQCAPGFEGDKCNVCKFGHFNYPSCTQCGCDPTGTDEKFCDENGICSCNENGQCNCKANVIGQKCDRCREGSYGLDKANSEGCMECFCFQRSRSCSQGYFKWQRLSLPSDRSVIPADRSDKQLLLINNLVVIPDQGARIVIEKDVSFMAPLYWLLPQIFLGDKVLSYNGFLRFHVISDRIAPFFPTKLLDSYPVVQLQGNHKLVLEHFPTEPSATGYHEIKLHEDNWRLKFGPYNGQVTKEVMMVALQNVQHILIRGTDTPEFFNATIFNVSLDIAIPSPNMEKSMAHGIEVCECPPEYNSTSCQNPRVGYYRWYKREYISSTVIIDLVGVARPCQCNDRSEVCDTENGNCQNCRENTGGQNCEVCAKGFYGNPKERCLPCPCPSTWNNHAESCSQMNNKEFMCNCRKGYTGKGCDRCDYGFFGTPWETGEHCEPCRCNPYGSVSDECDEITGQCNCRPGVTGRDCSKCAERHVIIGKICTACDGKCTGVLLNDLDVMMANLTQINISPDAALVRRTLANALNTTQFLEQSVDTILSLKLELDNMPSMYELTQMSFAQVKEMERESNTLFFNVINTRERAYEVLNKITNIVNEARGLVNQLDSYTSGTFSNINPLVAQVEARQIVEELEGQNFNTLKSDIDFELEQAQMIHKEVTEALIGIKMITQFKERVFTAESKLNDLRNTIDQVHMNVDEANILNQINSDLLSGRNGNLRSINNLTNQMDQDSILVIDLLTEGGYLRSETEQTLLILEDILKDLRNVTKEVEIREHELFELIPLYRVNFAQPAFTHVEMLKNHANSITSLFESIEHDGSKSIEGVTAYDRIKEGFDKAYEIATNTTRVAHETSEEIRAYLQELAIDRILEKSQKLITEGLNVSGIVENALRNSLGSMKGALTDLEWKMRITNDMIQSILNIVTQLEISEFSMSEFMERIEEIRQSTLDTKMEIMGLEGEIEKSKEKLNTILGGEEISAERIRAQLGETQEQLFIAEKATYDVEHLQQSQEIKADSLENKLKNLRALIQKSRHRADNVRVSIGPDETGTCFRLYKWPIVDDATSIVFNFAPTKKSDSLLFFWPSSINDDFVSIEMVNQKIRASWDLGSGLRTLNHGKKLVRFSENSDDPNYWFRISLERIGSSVKLQVLSIDIETGKTEPVTEESVIEYMNSGEEATLMNLFPDDLIHVGGFSKKKRTDIVSNGLSGCIHNLRVNHRTIGLWNFVGNEGCEPCTECPHILDDVRNLLEYYFDGRGYSIMKRIQSRVFNSKFLDISMEFRTFSENGLFFLTVNENLGQFVCIQLKEGRLVFHIRHRWGDDDDSLHIETDLSEKLNSGQWIELRAIWVYQKGVQTAQLTVGKTNFKKEKRSIGLTLELSKAEYQIGGIVPGFDIQKWEDLADFVPYVGCLKNLIIDGSTYDVLSGLFFGIESPCGGKTIHQTSFDGDGYAEYVPTGEKIFKFGFGFRTIAPTGILAMLVNNKKFDSTEEPFIGIHLENGQVRVQIGVYETTNHLYVRNETRFDDGIFHYIRLVKKNKRLTVFIDDEPSGSLLYKKGPLMSNTAHFRLLIGGINPQIQKKFETSSFPITRGYSGCLQNFFFEKEVLNFNHPISNKNQNLEQCSETLPLYEFMPMSSSGKNFLKSATTSLDWFRPETSSADASCYHTSRGRPAIFQEDTFKALHFGDSSDSYALVKLEGQKILKQRFNLTFHFRTFYPNGLFIHGIKRKGGNGQNGEQQCLTSFMKDGKIVIQFSGLGSRPQELVSSASNLNDGQWHQISIIKSDDKMYLHVDFTNSSQTRVPKLKPLTKLFVGGVPFDSQECFENSIQKPDYYKGCLKNLNINSNQINFEAASTQTHGVNPCFRSVEVGSFFRTGSYAIYSYNVTLGDLMEIELDFRSDSLNGPIITFVPNGQDKYPSFSIFLQDGNVKAKETIGIEESYEAVKDFSEDKSYVCNGLWHKIIANYDKGSISLRIDNFDSIFGLEEPSSYLNLTRYNPLGAHTVSGSLYIGGVEDAASRKKNQFHGCIRNILINRERRDWTDMSLLSNVLINACPILPI